MKDNITYHLSNFINEDEFNKIVVECLRKNNLTISELSTKIQKPVATIKNWANKKMYPPMIMRKSIVVALEKINNEKKV